jgi:hypothetical protein
MLALALMLEQALALEMVLVSLLPPELRLVVELVPLP